jgi:hypothetical protein
VQWCAAWSAFYIAPGDSPGQADFSAAAGCRALGLRLGGQVEHTMGDSKEAVPPSVMPIQRAVLRRRGPESRRKMSLDDDFPARTLLNDAAIPCTVATIPLGGVVAPGDTHQISKRQGRQRPEETCADAVEQLNRHEPKGKRSARRASARYGKLVSTVDADVYSLGVRLLRVLDAEGGSGRAHADQRSRIGSGATGLNGSWQRPRPRLMS